MEESNQLTKPNTGDRDQIIPTQNHLISSHLITRKQFQSQVIRPNKANRNSESLDDTYDISNLPDSILLEILSRLPLKSVFMFKCVCKHWLTLISHSSFKTFYFSRMQTLSLPFRILFSYIQDSGIEGVLDRLSYSSSETTLFLHMKRQHSFYLFFCEVIGVSNGLMAMYCHSLYRPWAFYVCDPVSMQRVRVALPRTHRSLRDPFVGGFVTRVDGDNIVTSFIVVIVSTEMKSLSKHLILDTFSSKTGKWSEYRLPCPIYIELRRSSVGPIVLNGILHWFVKDHGMVAFDPYKDPKSCRIIGLPVDRDVGSESTHDGLYQLCDACQGRLRYFQVAPDASSIYCFSMWVMKDYEKGEWRPEFKVTRSDLSSSDPELDSWLMKATFLPLCFDPLNLDIVYLRCLHLDSVVSYSIQNRKLDVACKLNAYISWCEVVPFVIPRWPTRVPIPPA